MDRRMLIKSIPTSIGMVVTGCLSVPQKSSVSPHTVTVLNRDFKSQEYQPHNITVTITNKRGEILFKRSYQLDDEKAADSQGKFDGNTRPHLINLVLDGRDVEKKWPTSDCGTATESGIVINIRLEKDKIITITGICENENRSS